MRLIRSEMDLPLAADPTDGFRAKGVRPGQANAARARSRADDLGPDNQGSPGKPVGAVVAAAKVLRTLHPSQRPLNAPQPPPPPRPPPPPPPPLLHTLQ